MNQNPTDTNNRPLVVGADYYLDQASPLTQYVGLFGQNLRFKIVYSDPEMFVSRSHYVHPTRLQGQAGGRRNSKFKSKGRKTKRRNPRKNKSRRRK